MNRKVLKSKYIGGIVHKESSRQGIKANECAYRGELLYQLSPKTKGYGSRVSSTSRLYYYFYIRLSCVARQVYVAPGHHVLSNFLVLQELNYNFIMSDRDADTRRTSCAHKIPRFHGKRGEDYGLWRLRLRDVCCAKKLWHLFDPAAPSASRFLDSDQYFEEKERTRSIIFAALGNSPLNIVADVDEEPARMLALLDDRFAFSRAASRTAVQTQLERKTYNGGNMGTFIDKFGTLFSQRERSGKDAAIPESHKAPMLLTTFHIDSLLDLTAAALRTKEVADLFWEFFATIFIDENYTRSMRTRNVDIDVYSYNGGWLSQQEELEIKQNYLHQL
jgi:hypothetical protein